MVGCIKPAVYQVDYAITIIVVVIMIKSSDPNFANTYRILRVLSNQDYLATDHKGVRYIFSQAKNALEPSSSYPNIHKYLLAHREVITIDEIKYAVFEVGNHEVEWAPFINSKKIEQEGFVQYIIKHSCQNILKQLIWMGSSQAKKYLNIKNVWLIDNKLYLLLLPRQGQLKFTIKKCEKRSLIKDNSIDLIIQAEKTLMKQFTLLLWQICFQCSLYQDKCVTSHSHYKQLLIRMANKNITFQQLLNELSKDPIETVYNKKIKFKTVDCRRSPPRRRIFTSFDKINKSFIQTLHASRSIKANTQSLKRPYETNQKIITQMQEANIMQNNSTIFIGEKRSMSLQNTNGNKKIGKSRTRYLNQNFTHTSSKETIQYERWLQNKKYSIQIREKLYKNGEMARKKFSQAFQNNTKQSSKEQKFDDSAFKEKILSKVIRFKNAMMSRHLSLQSNSEETIKSQPEKQLKIVQNVQRNLLGQKKYSQVKEELSQYSKNNQLPKRQRVVLKQEEQTVRQETPLLSNAESQQGRKIENDYLFKSQSKSLQEKKFDLNSLKTQKKKMNRIDIVTDISSLQDDLEEVKMPETRPVKVPPKPTIKLPAPTTKQMKTVNKQEFRLMLPDEGVSELLMLINTLGDITVRAVKNKDKLGEINWRLPTYFMYERFYLERERVAQALRDGQIVCRKHRRVDFDQWREYLKGQEKESRLTQVNRENEQIATTLNRLGQKVLQVEAPQRKIEYFIKNREKITAQAQPKLRAQLSKFLASSVVSEFDFAAEEGLKSKDVLGFLVDACFGVYVIAELDGVIPTSKLVRLDEYKEYDVTLDSLKSRFDFIEEAYFPKEEAWEAL